MGESNEVPSRQTLEGISERVLQLLNGVGRSKRIRAILAARGYSQAENRLGWRLLEEASGETSELVDDIDPAMNAKVAAVDSQDEETFAVAAAVLEHAHPEQHRFVFAGDLKPSKGLRAVLGMKLFLARLDQLQSSPEREATRASDHAALDALAAHGITPTVRESLKVTIDEITRGTPADFDALAAAPESSLEERLVALYRWHRKWSKIAHAVLTRRADLIACGLAERRARKSDDTSEEADPAPTPEVKPAAKPDAPVVAAPTNGASNGISKSVPAPARPS
jgi:hypothetical protein